MSAKRTAFFNQGRGKQHGAVLMIMLVIMIIGIAAILLSSLSSAALKTARKENTSAVLAQAKEALIGYAITYGDTHSGQVHGYLPCPDNAGGNPEGSAEPVCGTQDVSVIGRLPWATLDLSVLRDGDGECLWYAVSGTYKNSPKTGLMNWDTDGQLQAFSSDGTLLTQPDNQVVAIIFAPGTAQSGQDHSGTTAPVCGGNYTATNYLDNDTVHSINNSDVATKKFVQGASGSSVNDQMLFITRQDIWNAIKKRNDLGAFVSSLLNTATTCALPPVTVNFNNTPPTETSGVTVGSLKIGRIPKVCLASPLNNWQDNLLYATCTSGSCLSVNGNICSGVVIFSGERNTTQTRITNTDKNTWSNYLEDSPSVNLTAFTTGGSSFSGASSYSTASPSTDVLACIP
jgi:type II secretory pathway pseudopilin PulG